MKLEVIEIESCQKCRHNQQSELARWALSTENISYCLFMDRPIKIDDLIPFPAWCSFENVYK